MSRMSRMSASVNIGGMDLTASQVAAIRAALSDYRDRLPTKKATALEKLARKESTAILQLLGAEQ